VRSTGARLWIALMHCVHADWRGLVPGGTFALFSLVCRSTGINPLGHKAPAADRSLATYSYQPQEQRRHEPPEASTPASPTGVAGKLQEAFQNKVWLQKALMVAAVVATSMVLGDGVFTPAISGGCS
jgi:KUP system potassium uptake protein